MFIEFFKSADDSTPIPELTQGAPQPTLTENALKALLLSGIGGSGLYAAEQWAKRQPPPYDPKNIIKKLKNVSAINPSVNELDIPYPVLKRAGITGWPGELWDAASNHLGEATVLGPAVAGGFVGGRFAPGATLGAAAGGMGAYALGHNLPATAVGAIGGGLLGHGVQNALSSGPDALDEKQRLQSSKYIEDELRKAKEKYHNTLLENQINHQLLGHTKLSEAVDKLYEKTALGENVPTSVLQPWWNRWSQAADDFTGTAHTIGNIGLGGLATLSLGAGPYGYMATKSDLDAKDPIKDQSDIEEDLRKAILLRSRALATGRGLPPIYVNAKPIDISDRKTPSMVELEQKKKQDQLKMAEAKATILVESLFE